MPPTHTPQTKQQQPAHPVPAIWLGGRLRGLPPQAAAARVAGLVQAAEGHREGELWEGMGVVWRVGLEIRGSHWAGGEARVTCVFQMGI